MPSIFMTTPPPASDEDVEHALRHQFHPETERKVYRGASDYTTEPLPEQIIDEWHRVYPERLRRVFQSWTSEWEQPPEYWSAEMDDMAAEADDYAKRWNALMARLRTYEQLYIAA